MNGRVSELAKIEQFADFMPICNELESVGDNLSVAPVFEENGQAEVVFPRGSNCSTIYPIELNNSSVKRDFCGSHCIKNDGQQNDSVLKLQ